MAATLLGSLLVSLGLESGAFRSGLSDAEKQMRTAQKNFERIGANFQKVGAVLTVGITAPFTALTASAIPAAIESQQAAAQVTAALASMGNAAGRSANQLTDLAGRLQNTSNFDDDDIMKSVTANLLTFGKISGTVFDRAEQDIIDYAARTGTDLQSATIMFAKALQDPVHGLAALGKTGAVTRDFIAANQDRIKAMVDGGNIAQAQGLILDNLETQYRGAAQAQRDATPGAAAQQAWRTFQENVGAVALNVMPSLSNAVAGVLNAFNTLSPGTQSTIIAMTAVAAAAGPVLGAFGSIVRIAAPTIAAFAQVSVAEGATTAATVTFSAAWRAMAATIGVGLAFGAIAGAIWLVQQRMSEGTAASGAFAKAQDALRTVHDQLDGATQRLATTTGAERVAALAAAQAARDAAKAQLARAQANLVAASSELRLAEAAQTKAQTLAQQGGMIPTGGMFGMPDLAGVGAQDRAGARVTQAQTNMKAARDTLSGLNAEIAKADAAIKSATTTVPHFGAAIAAAGERGRAGIGQVREATSGLGKDFDDAADRAKGLIDRLYPRQAAFADLTKSMSDLSAYAKRAGWSVDQLADAQRRLRVVTDGGDPDAQRTGIGEAEGAAGTAIVPNAEKVADETDKIWDRVTLANTNVAESWAAMTRDVAGSLQGLVGSIRSHDWLGALQGIADTIAKLFGSSGIGQGFGSLFGSRAATGGIAGGTFPISGARALGGPVLPHQAYLIGERGPEILRMGGAGGSIVPNHMIGGPSIVQVHVVANDYFDARVGQVSGGVTATAINGAQRNAATRNRQSLA